MGKKVVIIAFVLMAFVLGISPWDLNAAGVLLGPNLEVPPNYKPAGKRCRPGGGYVFKAELSNYPSAFPKMNLRVFNGEVIGFLFEVDAKEGWKPWYDQEEGKPTSHGGSIPHYTQTIFVKKGPTAAECKTSKGPFGK